MNGLTLTWDANGNLLQDQLGRVYTYDSADRLTSLVQGGSTFTFSYNGLGDRLRQTVNGVPTDYSLDLSNSLTQVLSDGTNTYLYGVGRIGEQNSSGWGYHLGDALGSVRQLSDPTGVVTLARAYQPYGSALSSEGEGLTSYGFTGEWRDLTGLVHLRARYYDPALGRFPTRDPFPGVLQTPATQHNYIYAANNPINYFDPSGMIWLDIINAQSCQAVTECDLVELAVGAGDPA